MKQIEVIYLGERLTMNDKIVQVFRDAEGKESYFSGVKRVWVGDSYLMSEKGTIKAKPERVENPTLKMNEEDEAKYQAQKIVCRDYRLTRQKEMKLKQPHEDILKAIELLRPFARGLSWYDNERFFTYIKNESTKPKKKEEIK